MMFREDWLNHFQVIELTGFLQTDRCREGGGWGGGGRVCVCVGGGGGKT